MIKRMLCLWLTIASPFAWSTVADLDALQAQLSQHDTVRGDFTQKRHIEMFEQPLSSEGQFTLNKEQGLLWQQTTPFPVGLVLTQDKLRQTFAGQTPKVITAKENPMAFYFSHIFLAVFHGDTHALKEQFDIAFNAGDKQWTLVLTPLNAPLNAVFEAITLTGNDNIDRLELNELRGDKTDILFTNQTHQPEGLTDAEKAQFSF